VRGRQVTFEEACAEIAILTPLVATDLDELRAAKEQDDKDGGNRVELGLRALKDAERFPDKTGWQKAADTLGKVDVAAGEIAPLLGLVGAIAAMA
jgi:hypothetical protein